jgi:hypothetical protein
MLRIARCVGGSSLSGDRLVVKTVKNHQIPRATGTIRDSAIRQPRMTVINDWALVAFGVVSKVNVGVAEGVAAAVTIVVGEDAIGEGDAMCRYCVAPTAGASATRTAAKVTISAAGARSNRYLIKVY